MNNIYHTFTKILQHKKAITITVYVFSGLLLFNAFTGFPLPTHGCSDGPCSLVSALYQKSTQEYAPFEVGSGTTMITDHIQILDASLSTPLIGSGGILEESALVNTILQDDHLRDSINTWTEQTHISPEHQRILEEYLTKKVKNISATLVEQQHQQLQKQFEALALSKLPMYSKKGTELALVQTLNERYGSNTIFEVNSLEKTEQTLPGDIADSKRFTITVGTSYQQLKTFFSDIAATYRFYETEGTDDTLPLLDIYSVKITPPAGGSITTATDAEITLDVLMRKVDEELYDTELVSLNALEATVNERLSNNTERKPVLEEKVATLLELIANERELLLQDEANQEYHEALARVVTLRTLFEEILKQLL